MSTWLTFFQSYLNPGKLAAVTVPGMVIAFALVLALGPVPCQKPSECPYCSANLTPVKDTTAKAKSSSPANMQWFIQGFSAKLGDPPVQPTQSSGQPSPPPSKGPIDQIIDLAKQQHPVPDITGLSKCSNLPKSVVASSAALLDLTDLKGLGNAAPDTSTGNALYAVNFDGKMPTIPNKTLLPVSTSDLNLCYAGLNQNWPSGSPIVDEISKVLSLVTTLREQLLAAPLPVPGQLSIQISQQKIDQESTLSDIRAAIQSADTNNPQDMRTNLEARNLRVSLKPIQHGPNLLGSEYCGLLPRYEDPNGPAVLDAAGIKKAMDAAKKSFQSLVDLGSLQDLAIQCKQEIVNADIALTHNAGLLDKFTTQGYTDLGTLATSKTSAQSAGQTLVEGSLTGKVKQKQDLIVWAQSEAIFITTAQTNLSKLKTDISTIGQFGTNAPKSTSPQTSTAVDVLAAIQDNLIKFLILSLIIGQILDPLQRGVVSFFGPRRDFFIAFNEVYGRKGDGEFRYGERRLWPFVLRNRKPIGDEASIAAARAFAKDPNIYDKNYAIGAGYITHSDSQTIENDWFTQSQLTSGLVFPMVVLSLSLGIRAVCCSATASGSWGGPTAIILCSMPLAVILGGFLTWIFLHLSSVRYGQVAGGFFHLFSTPKTDRFVRSEEHGTHHDAGEHRAEKIWLWSRGWWLALFFVVAVIVGAVAVLATVPKLNFGSSVWLSWLGWAWWPWNFLLGWAPSGPDFPSLALILSPVLFVIPLWVAGLDRLHKYYSELEARIGGNILRLEATIQQKFIDILSDPTASCALKAKLDETVDAQTRLHDVFKGLDCTAVQAAGDPVAGPAAAVVAASSAVVAAAAVVAASGTVAPAATPDPTQAGNSPTTNG